VNAKESPSHSISPPAALRGKPANELQIRSLLQDHNSDLIANFSFLIEFGGVKRTEIGSMGPCVCVCVWSRPESVRVVDRVRRLTREEEQNTRARHSAANWALTVETSGLMSSTHFLLELHLGFFRGGGGALELDGNLRMKRN